MSVDVFISYHSATSQHLAAVVQDKLEGMGLNCWYSGKDLGGGDYAGGIMRALNQCRVYVLLLNGPASESAHVLNELEVVTNRLARKEDVVIMPFRTTNEDVSQEARYYIQRHHWIDATSGNMMRHVDELAEQIQALLSSEEDVAEREAYQKRQKTLLLGKLAAGVVLAGLMGLLYKGIYSACPDTHLYYLMHLLLTFSPVVLLLFDGHEGAGKKAAGLANLMIWAAVAVFAVISFQGLRLDVEKIWQRTVEMCSTWDEAKIKYAGAYIALVLFPWFRDLMRTGKWRGLWSLVCIVIGGWVLAMGVDFVSYLMAGAAADVLQLCACAWACAVGVYILLRSAADLGKLLTKGMI